MKLLLRRDIPKVGLAGDVIEVSEGYARNYLIPNHLGVEPTKANMKRIEEDKRLAEEERRQRRVALEQMAGRMSNVEVTISAACNREGHLYGSVGPREIAAALRDEGHDVDAKQVQLREPIRQLDSVVVPVLLADDIQVDVKVWVVRETGSIVEEDEEEDRRRPEKPGREAHPYDRGTGVDALDLDL
ncbi:MAG: 50S ribosomal protein L9 [Planctomycetes bacterium]|nr:50S ribosomal protein L9 [Planctomycetota bacterium]